MNSVLASAIQAASVRLINRNWFELDEETQAETTQGMCQETDIQIGFTFLKGPDRVAMKDESYFVI